MSDSIHFLPWLMHAESCSTLTLIECDFLRRNSAPSYLPRAADASRRYWRVEGLEK